MMGKCLVLVALLLPCTLAGELERFFRLGDVDRSYHEGYENEICFESCVRLPFDPLVFCCAVVLGYIVYILIAFLLKPVIRDRFSAVTKEHAGMMALLSDHRFHDNIVPSKIRGLFDDSIYVPNALGNVPPSGGVEVHGVTTSLPQKVPLENETVKSGSGSIQSL